MSDALDYPGLVYSGDPNFVYGRSATKHAKNPANIVLHHAVGTADGLVKYGKKIDYDRKTPAAYGYHFYIGKDGRVHQGAPLSKRTNHVKSPKSSARYKKYPSVRNSNSIGVSLVNGHKKITPAQEATMKKLIPVLQQKYGIPNSNIVGHGELQRDRQSIEGRWAKNFRTGDWVPSGIPLVQPASASAQQKPTGIINSLMDADRTSPQSGILAGVAKLIQQQQATGSGPHPRDRHNLQSTQPQGVTPLSPGARGRSPIPMGSGGGAYGGGPGDFGGGLRGTPNSWAEFAAIAEKLAAQAPQAPQAPQQATQQANLAMGQQPMLPTRQTPFGSYSDFAPAARIPGSQHPGPSAIGKIPGSQHPDLSPRMNISNFFQSLLGD